MLMRDLGYSLYCAFDAISNVIVHVNATILCPFIGREGAASHAHAV